MHIFYENNFFVTLSVHFSRSVVSDSMQPHGLQQARPPCPSPTPGVYSNSCPLSRWCHPTISFSVAPFSSRLQSFPAWGSFQMSQFFTSSGQSIGVSASTSVLSKNIQDWFSLGWTCWISLQSKEFSSLLQHHSSKAPVLRHSAFFTVQLSYPYMTLLLWLVDLCWQSNVFDFFLVTLCYIGNKVTELFKTLQLLILSQTPSGHY